MKNDFIIVLTILTPPLTAEVRLQRQFSEINKGEDADDGRRVQNGDECGERRVEVRDGDEDVEGDDEPEQEFPRGACAQPSEPSQGLSNVEDVPLFITPGGRQLRRTLYRKGAREGAVMRLNDAVNDRTQQVRRPRAEALENGATR